MSGTDGVVALALEARSGARRKRRAHLATWDGVLVVSAPRGRGPCTETFATAAEHALASRLSEPRASEVLEGRALVHWGLAHAQLMTCPTASVLRDGDGGPSWSCGPGRCGSAGRCDARLGPVSIAHSRSVVVVAVGGGRGPRLLGVDAQEVEHPMPGVLRRCAHPEDLERLAGLAGAELADAFTRLWTVLEACAKARRASLLTTLGRVRVPPGDHHGSSGGTSWTSWAQGADVRLALAAEQALDAPHLLRFCAADNDSDLIHTSDTRDST